MWTPLAPLNRRITADHLVFSLFWLLENGLIPFSFLEKVSCLASSSTIPYQPLFSYLMPVFWLVLLRFMPSASLESSALSYRSSAKIRGWRMVTDLCTWSSSRQSGPFGEKVWILSSDGKTPDSADSEWTAEGKWALDSGAVIESSSFNFKESLLSESFLFLSKETDSRYGSPRKNLTWSSN